MSAQPKLERILVAMDLLENSRLALDYAVAFAHQFHAALEILHVVELSSPAREAEAISARPSVTRLMAREKLEAIAIGIRRTEVDVTPLVEDGDPGDVIPRIAAARGADMLVLGVHGVYRGIEHLLIGSNTEKILLSAQCPVLTVGAHVLAGLDVTLPLERVLYYSDLSPESAHAAPFACFLSRTLDVPIEICQALPPGLKDNHAAAMLLAKDFCEAVGETAPDADSIWRLPSFQLDRGMQGEELLARAASLHSSVIVLGAHRETHFGRHLHTSFVYQLLAEATCPVISVLGSASGEK